MYTQVFYLLRSKQDGRHLAARQGEGEETKTFLLLFAADHEALTYLSTHAPETRDRFTVESVTLPQVGGLIQRWGFAGMAMVRDPLEPKVDFVGTRTR
ncbi:MAG: hypothetical protein O3C67_13700 [Cyanobacteria bacterium]|nr:hypothetical protein [Cyanobacteriota bacterium]